VLECSGDAGDRRVPVGTEVVQIMTAEAVQAPASTPVAPVNEKPRVCKLLKRDGDSKALILKLDGKEDWFPLTEDGKKNLVRLKDGQNVKLGFETVNGVYHLKMLLPADESGKYDRDGWVKTPLGGPKGDSWRNKQKSPDERRSIELQSCLRTVSDVFIAAMNASKEPVNTSFAEMMSSIREEALLSADWIRDHSKEVSS